MCRRVCPLFLQVPYALVVRIPYVRSVLAVCRGARSVVQVDRRILAIRNRRYFHPEIPGSRSRRNAIVFPFVGKDHSCGCREAEVIAIAPRVRTQIGVPIDLYEEWKIRKRRTDVRVIDGDDFAVTQVGEPTGRSARMGNNRKGQYTHSQEHHSC